MVTQLVNNGHKISPRKSDYRAHVLLIEKSGQKKKKEKSGQVRKSEKRFQKDMKRKMDKQGRNSNFV